MESMTRRTFFFLGLGLMGGKSLYKPSSLIYQPTLKQIQFVTSTRVMRVPLTIHPGFFPYKELYRVMKKGELMIDYDNGLDR